MHLGQLLWDITMALGHLSEITKQVPKTVRNVWQIPESSPGNLKVPSLFIYTITQINDHLEAEGFGHLYPNPGYLAPDPWH